MVINITKPGTLSTLVGAKKYNETSLIINGNINSDDIICIRDMCGKNNTNSDTQGICITLDLSNTKIVEGGESYFMNITTNNDKIGDYMFFDLNKLQSIILPASISSIGECAFSNCTSLKNISMFNNVISIDDGAFNNCSNVTSLTLSNTLSSIGSYVFQSMSNLKTLSIPSMITSIGSFAFNNCINLSEITLTSNPPIVGYSLFFQCDSLIKINVPSGYYSIYVGSMYWSNYSNLIDDGCEKNGSIVKSIYSGNEISMGMFKLKNTGKLR